MNGPDDTATELVPLPDQAEIRRDYFDHEIGPAALSHGDGDVTLILGGDDLRLAHFTEQVVAAVHGDIRVLDLPPEAQEAIARVSRAFEVHASGILRDRDPAETVRRAAVVLVDGGQEGTPMRCPQCQRVHHPLGGPPDWGIAGREDIACGPCVKATPKHAVKAEVVKPAAAKPAPRRRPPRRKPAGGAT